MIKKGIIILFILTFSISLVSAIISEPKNPTLEITSKTQLIIKTETGPLVVQLKPIGDLKNNLVLDKNEFKLQPNSQQVINLQLKKVLEGREYVFINVLYENPSDDAVLGDNTIILELKSVSNKPLLLTLKEDIPIEKPGIVEMGFNIIPLLVVAFLILFVYKKKWQKRK